MSRRDEGQGAPAVAPEPPARSPERQALADAIAERARVASLVEARQALGAAFSERRRPWFAEQEEIEAQLERASGLDSDRLSALLRGEEPGANTDKKTLERRHAELEGLINKSRDEERLHKADTELLQNNLGWCVAMVEQRIVDVIQADASIPAVVSEINKLQRRVGILLSAIEGPLSKYHAGQRSPNLGRGIQCMPMAPSDPTPWDLAFRSLHNDADAVLPMPDAV